MKIVQLALGELGEEGAGSIGLRPMK